MTIIQTSAESDALAEARQLLADGTPRQYIKGHSLGCPCVECVPLHTAYMQWWRSQRKGRPALSVPRDLIASLVAIIERPDRQPTVQPTVEQVAQAIYDTAYDGVPLWAEERNRTIRNEYLSEARAVLALLPGRSEAEVRRDLLWAQVDAWDEGYAAGLTPPCNANPYHAAALAADRIEARS